MENIYPYKILFVEDEKAIRENYVTYLKMFFSEVFEAEDGEKAYELYKSKKPDIMIVDINIPKMNGLELLEKIRENDYSTKAIMLTAHSDKSFLLKAVTLKLTKYLVKPISRKEINEALELTISELLKYDVSPIQKINLSLEYSWNVQLKELKHHNNVIELTNKERNFLGLLFSHKNRVFTYEEIFEHVWGYDESITINGLKNMVKRLRKKLPENTILNIFNEGYKINF
ncbi:MAG: response regulator transcription factor [Arcobacter sp.]|jgi:DNA-binding response OmpR family regulator|uniref:Two-component system response regulator n=1 Tax=Arcobacter defluvii TaxID=873191 RepID=A0AAE7BHD9_9BACT|nr:MULTISPECIES: response regulator transcription factor [Arcobacter]MDY3200673.1 response regulator transcription factor [Arcobacter sp.]QKF77792.1 two-component system response regulator [Arcobacter defluvii]BAK73599.1 two-component response regulator [Arcobacter sp. L]